MHRENLELVRQYGPELWSEHLEQVDNAMSAMEKRNAIVKAEIEDINRRRKFSAVSFAEEESRLHAKTVSLAYKNTVLEEELVKLQTRDFEESTFEPEQKRQVISNMCTVIDRLRVAS